MVNKIKKINGYEDVFLCYFSDKGGDYTRFVSIGGLEPTAQKVE